MPLVVQTRWTVREEDLDDAGGELPVLLSWFDSVSVCTCVRKIKDFLPPWQLVRAARLDETRSETGGRPDVQSAAIMLSSSPLL